MPRHPAALEPGLRLLERYEVLHLVHEGPQSMLYRGRDLESGRDVALKLAPGGARAEAELLARLDHPNVISQLASGYYLVANERVAVSVLPWLMGLSLGDRLQVEELPLGASLLVGIALAEALQHIHARRIAHADLKPSNVWLRGGEPDQATLIDFGSARELSVASAARLGTPGYAAPEQLRGAAIGPEADVFALGCVLSRLVQGRQAFAGRTPALVALATLNEMPVLDRFPEELDELIRGLLVKDPARRVSDLAHVAARLRECHEQAGPERLRSVPSPLDASPQVPTSAVPPHPQTRARPTRELEVADWLRLRLRRRRELLARCLELGGTRREWLEALLAHLPEPGEDFDLGPGSPLWSHPALVGLGQELRALPAQATRVLQALCVLGEAEIWLISAVARIPEATIEALLQSAWVAPWIHRGVRGLRVCAELPSRLLLDQLSQAERRSLHRRSAELLIAEGARDPLALEAIATHWSGAGEIALAARAFIDAARQASRGSDALETIRLGRRALVHAGSDLELRMLLAEAHNVAGMPAQAISHAEHVVAQSDILQAAWWTAHRELAVAWRRCGSYARLRVLAESLLANPAQQGSSLAELRCVVRVAEELAYTEHAALGVQLVERLPRLDGTVATERRALLHDAESTRAYIQGQLVCCQSAIRAAGEAYRVLGDHQRAVARDVYLGWSQIELGQLSDAEQTLTRARERALDLGCWPVVASAEQNLGFCLALRGDLARGVALLSSAVKRGVEQEHRRLLVGAHELLARVRLLAGDWAGAAESAERGLAELSTLVEPQRTPLIVLLAQARLAGGQLEQAESIAELAWAGYAAGVGLEGTERLWVMLGRADVLEAVQRRTEAQVLRRAARDFVERRAEQIVDVRERARFFRDAPECARALTAVD